MILQQKTKGVILLSMLVVVGCAFFKPDIQQGNYVTEKEVNQLYAGMSKREVRFIMGTPLIVDPFHTNRWDYFYSIKTDKHRKKERQRVTLIFNEDALSEVIMNVEGDALEQSTEETGGTRIDEPVKKKGRFKRIFLGGD